MSYRLSFAVFLLLVAFVYVSGPGQREPRADFVYVNPSDIHTLDPARMSWSQDFRVALNLWEGLTTTDPSSGLPIEGAANFPPDISPDALEYTFTLRDDASWSNGDAVTSADFVRGWRRAMEPGTAADYTFLFTEHIDGAAEYVQWRREAVTVLTALKRRADGWALDAAQAAAIANAPLVNNALMASSFPADTSTDQRRHKGDSALEIGPGGREPDWSAIHATAHAIHAAAMDKRFAKVGVESRDDRTLVIRLARPCPYFLDLTAFPAFLPCHESIETLRERHNDSPITAEGLVAYDPQWTKPQYRRAAYPGLITNGPYRLAEWRFKRHARLEVNPYSRFANQVDCRTVDMLVIPNLNAAYMAYEAGEVDFLPALEVSYSHELVRLSKSGARSDFHLTPTLATFYFFFNCAESFVDGVANPFVDPRVRRAFCLAADRETVVSHVLARGDRPAQTLVPPGLIPGYESPTGLGQDSVEARRLLAEAGYQGGAGFPPVELLHLSADEKMCQAMARMWRDVLGVSVSLRSKESKTFAADRAAQRFFIARGNWYGDYFDPATFLDCFRSGDGHNAGGYAAPRFDALLAKAAVASAAERFKLLRHAETVLVEEDAALLPILHYTSLLAIQPNVSGLEPNPRLRFSFRHVRVTR